MSDNRVVSNELIELSKRVAAKLGTHPKEWGDYDNPQKESHGTWLHEDSARCFELMCEHKLNLDWDFGVEGKSCVDVAYTNKEAHGYCEYAEDHNNDLAQATRVAILKALEAL